jgi:hypothetical protein
MIINEVGRIGKEAVVAYFKTLSEHLFGGTEENYNNNKTVRIAGLQTNKHSFNSTSLKNIPPSNILT